MSNHRAVVRRVRRRERLEREYDLLDEAVNRLIDARDAFENLHDDHFAATIEALNDILMETMSERTEVYDELEDFERRKRKADEQEFWRDAI